jgi:hypothetical protein
MRKFIPIAIANAIAGTCTVNSKMPSKTYNLPTVACQTGFKMAQIPGSVCSECYADKGLHAVFANTIEPGQHARLDAVLQACNDAEQAKLWIMAIVSLIRNDAYFRWHSAGDIQSVAHLRLIAQVCEQTPHCMHWLPTREYAMVRDYIAQYGALPTNLMVRLSAMYPDKAVTVPKSLQGIANVATSNVHKVNAPIGTACNAPSQNGECRDCRACWHSSDAISYAMH